MSAYLKNEPGPTVKKKLINAVVSGYAAWTVMSKRLPLIIALEPMQGSYRWTDK
jgi:hypothetical protein